MSSKVIGAPVSSIVWSNVINVLSNWFAGSKTVISAGIVNFVLISLPKSVEQNNNVLSIPSKDDLVPKVTFAFNSAIE